MEDDFDAFVRGHLTSLTGFGRLLAGHDARAQDLVQEAPVIQQSITGGQFQITGGSKAFTADEARTLAAELAG